MGLQESGVICQNWEKNRGFREVRREEIMGRPRGGVVEARLRKAIIDRFPRQKMRKTNRKGGRVGPVNRGMRWRIKVEVSRRIEELGRGRLL